MSGQEEGTVLAQGRAGFGPWWYVLEDAVADCTRQVRMLASAMSGDGQLSWAEYRREAARLYEFAEELLECCEDLERWMKLRADGWERTSP